MTKLTALVTGSTRGIGTAIMVQLRARGVIVIGATLDANGASYVR